MPEAITLAGVRERARVERCSSSHNSGTPSRETRLGLLPTRLTPLALPTLIAVTEREGVSNEKSVWVQG